MGTSYIQDSIHGQIYLTPLEFKVIDSLEFQRLRFIRQNSLLHYVFPGAFHTRFSHSLGTCHLSSKVFAHLFKEVKEQKSNYIAQVFRLAALMHDVGHGAFSHLLTHITINGNNFLPPLKELFSNPEDWEVNSEFLTSFFKTQNPEKTIEHEHLSLILINKIITEASSTVEDSFGDIDAKTLAQDICALLTHEIPTTEYFKLQSQQLLNVHSDDIIKIDKGFDPNTASSNISQILSQLVSGTLDVDRMDYLIRDSKNCGINYGLYDQEGLISAINLSWVNQELHLSLSYKRANTLDDFLWSRYQMFKQIYCHKTHEAFNILLNLAMNDLANRDLLTSPRSLKDYLRLTDDFIMSKVFEEVQNKPEETSWMRALAKRDLPKLIGTVESSTNDKVWELSAKEIFKKKFNQSEENLYWAYQKAEVLRDSLKSPLPKLYKKDKFTGEYSEENYLDNSVFFNTNLKSEYRLEELTNRLNKKILYFYRM